MHLFVTMNADAPRYGDWNLEARGHGHGLDFVLSTCGRFDVHCTCFVGALSATRWGLDPFKDFCTAICEAGHEIQLGIQPDAAELDGLERGGALLAGYSCAVQSRLIRTGLRILYNAGVLDVRACRGLGGGANLDTLAAIAANGLHLSANRSLSTGDGVQSEMEQGFPVRNDLSRRGGILDLPLSSVRSTQLLASGEGTYRGLDLGASSFREIREALTKLNRSGVHASTLLMRADDFFVMQGRRALPIPRMRQRLEDVMGWVQKAPFLEPAVVSRCGRDIEPAEKQSPVPRLGPIASLLRRLEQRSIVRAAAAMKQ